ncbi:GW dipeptide domain-containing protein [Aromatoleum sp.]|uniref:GW dipeptide domain-containing protein n=1 Tax=Aromatoleum sp. TaxID=2307007 RepID=UPI002FCC729E
MNRWLLLAVAASVGLAACSKKEEPAAPAAEAPQSAAPASGPVASQAATPNSGKVVQLEQGGGYTYAQVETTPGQQVWIAGGHIDVRPGDTVQWGDYAVMTNFNAKSLGRVFDEILFVNAWGPAGGATTGVAPHGVQPGQQAAAPHAAATASASDTAAASAQSVGIVKSAAKAGGYSYLEVEQNGSTLWVAAPETQVKAGDKVSWDSGMVMRDFKSSSLNRTFGEIVFAGAVRVIQ